jgi:hypothetical protein
MMKFLTVAAVSAMALTATLAPMPAHAENGRIAAGVATGLVAGAIVGSSMNRDDGYRGDRGYYRSSYRECRIERQDFEDRYGRLHVRSVRVCD